MEWKSLNLNNEISSQIYNNIDMTVIKKISFPVKISSTTYWKLFYNLIMRFITKVIIRFLIRNSAG